MSTTFEIGRIPAASRRDFSQSGDGDGCAGAEVPGAADDLARLALADVHPRELQAVRVRVLLGLEHAPHAEPVEVAVDLRNADPLDSLDLRGRDRELGRKLVDRERDRNVLAQPADRDFQNWRRTRRSPSQSSRMSGISWRS